MKRTDVASFDFDDPSYKNSLPLAIAGQAKSGQVVCCSKGTGLVGRQLDCHAVRLCAGLTSLLDIQSG